MVLNHLPWNIPLTDEYFIPSKHDFRFCRRFYKGLCKFSVNALHIYFSALFQIYSATLLQRKIISSYSGCCSSPSWYDYFPLPLLLTPRKKQIPVYYFIPVITSNFPIISTRHLVIANVIIRISFNQSQQLHLILQHSHCAKMNRIRYQIRGKFVNSKKIIFS